jgi:superfamily I DNA/RNA helicase
LAAYDMARSRLVPAGEMPAEVRRFAVAWDEWKRSVNAIDFTDMISLALERALDGERAPGNPQVLISDEAQDMTPLETALVLAWGGLAGETILALDDDQAINAWRGGDPAPILALGSGEGVNVVDRVLDQSYRIPSSVHAVSQSWIEACTARRLKPYRPRDVAGQIYAVSHPIEAMPTAEAIARDAHAGRSVLVLAACEYMLRQLITNLKKIGVPFGNHYRPAETRWNPLSSAVGMTPAHRLFRFLVMDEASLGGWSDQGGRAHLWTGDDVRAWLELVAVKEAGLVRGAKTVAKHLPSGELDIAQVEGLFASDEALVRATVPELGWLLECARGLKGMTEKLTYPAAVAKAHGPAALVDRPKVVVGTIHSAKGAEAEVVYLSPSVSGAGHQEWLRGGRARDNARRQFYVGLTRAERTCVVLGSSERSVPRAALIPPELWVR